MFQLLIACESWTWYWEWKQWLPLVLTHVEYICLRPCSYSTLALSLAPLKRESTPRFKGLGNAEINSRCVGK